ncbi:MAG: purine phosphorylase [Gammaproteobacteria bacterium]
MGTRALSESDGRQALTVVGLVAALPEELRMLTRHALVPGSCARLSEGLWVSLSGIGPQRAVAAGEQLLANGATALVSWGNAGALDGRLAAGDLMLPRQIIGSDGSLYWADKRWHGRLCERLAGRFTVHTGALAQSPCLVATRTEKRSLHNRVRAMAVDMESGALAQLAARRRVPYLAVRAITDTAVMGIPRSVVNAIDAAGRVRLMRLLGGILMHPGDLRALVHLGRNFRAARSTLARLAADSAADLLASHPRAHL